MKTNNSFSLFLHMAMNPGRKVPLAGWILGLLLYLVVPDVACSQSATSLLRDGNKLYERGKYKEAEKSYRKGLEKSKQSVKGQFNLGDAVYKQKNFAESSKIFGDLTGTNMNASDKAKIYHNLGNSLLESKEYEKSILAYKKSLMNDPSDRDTKYNLEYARMMLHQQQQQQQQNQNKNDKDKKDQQDKQQQQQPQQNKENQDKKDKSQDEKKISKEEAERMLEALKNEEKKTLQKVEKKKVQQANQMIIEKDW
jgi:Ca-activated chloride channel homolog